MVDASLAFKPKRKLISEDAPLVVRFHSIRRIYLEEIVDIYRAILETKQKQSGNSGIDAETLIYMENDTHSIPSLKALELSTRHFFPNLTIRTFDGEFVFQIDCYSAVFVANQADARSKQLANDIQSALKKRQGRPVAYYYIGSAGITFLGMFIAVLLIPNSNQKADYAALAIGLLLTFSLMVIAATVAARQQSTLVSTRPKDDTESFFQQNQTLVSSISGILGAVVGSLLTWLLTR